jgi:hypothetical protein
MTSIPFAAQFNFAQFLLMILSCIEKLLFSNIGLKSISNFMLHSVPASGDFVALATANRSRKNYVVVAVLIYIIVFTVLRTF